VDRDGDQPDERERVVEEHPFEPRRSEDPEGRTLRDPEREEPVRKLGDALARLRPRDGLPRAVPLDEVCGLLALLGLRSEPQIGHRARLSGRLHVEASLTGSPRTDRNLVGEPEKCCSSYNLETTMRTTWNGTISFGLVSIPIGLAPATKPAARQSDVSFRLLHRECATPIKQKRWCPTHDREVTQDEIVRGFEVTKGQFIIVEDADLEAIERADDSRSIEITRFVKEDQVDPIFFDRTYFLVPGAAPAQRRPYVLLLEAMHETDTAALR